MFNFYLRIVRSVSIVRAFVPVLAFALFAATLISAQADSSQPGSRSIMDAHNCYPYFEWWEDRMDRALAAGVPVAIEQDLAWYTDSQSGKSWSVVTHGAPMSGHEPTLEKYFFERVRAVVEDALRRQDHRNWPIITLNLDFKSEEPEHLAALWTLLEKYRAWITSAPRTADLKDMRPLEIKPILVLTGGSDQQQQVFYDKVRVGEDLLVFGSVKTNLQDPMAAPEVIAPDQGSNYRRWWNNPWNVVERGVQTQAGDWTAQSETRLRSLVELAHSRHLWIRFYTLDGATAQERNCHGWFRSYSFSSLPAAQERWRACARAGVDFIASDHYEALAELLRSFAKN